MKKCAESRCRHPEFSGNGFKPHGFRIVAHDDGLCRLQSAAIGLKSLCTSGRLTIVCEKNKPKKPKHFGKPTDLVENRHAFERAIDVVGRPIAEEYRTFRKHHALQTHCHFRKSFNQAIDKTLRKRAHPIVNETIRRRGRLIVHPAMRKSRSDKCCSTGRELQFDVACNETSATRLHNQNFPRIMTVELCFVARANRLIDEEKRVIAGIGQRIRNNDV